MTFQPDAFQSVAYQGLYVVPNVNGITGTYLFDPALAECFEDAFERAGISPRGVSQEHLTSAMRSCRFMLNSEWSTLGIRQWMIEQIQRTAVAGDSSIQLPQGTVDVLCAFLRRNQGTAADIPLYPISRIDFNDITTKSRRGRPNQYFIEKRYDQVIFHYWNTAENSTDVFFIDCFRQVSDVGEMFNTLQMPPMAQDCFVTGLAMRLAQKFQRDRYDELRIEYGGPAYPMRHDGKLFHMRAESGERADTVLRVPRGRWR